MSEFTSRFRVKNRITVVLVVVVLAALTFSLVALTRSSKPLTVTNEAGSNCAPYNFPVVKLGHHASVSVAFDGYRATYSATATKKDTISGGPSGMPFTGTLTVSNGARSWRLPAPSVTKNYQIDDLCVISFEKGLGPAVLTEGFTGGAHCCELPVLYSLVKSSQTLRQGPRHDADELQVRTWPSTSMVGFDQCSLARASVANRGRSIRVHLWLLRVHPYAHRA